MLHIFKQWPKIDEACTPAAIIWENIGKSKKTTRIRTCLNWMIAILLLIISTTCTILIMNRMARIAEDYNFKIDCPAK